MTRNMVLRKAFVSLNVKSVIFFLPSFSWIDWLWMQQRRKERWSRNTLLSSRRYRQTRLTSIPGNGSVRSHHGYTDPSSCSSQ